MLAGPSRRRTRTSLLARSHTATPTLDRVTVRPTTESRGSRATDLVLAAVTSLVAVAVILRLYETSTTAADYDVYREAARLPGGG